MLWRVLSPQSISLRWNLIQHCLRTWAIATRIKERRLRKSYGLNPSLIFLLLLQDQPNITEISSYSQVLPMLIKREPHFWSAWRYIRHMNLCSLLGDYLVVIVHRS